jgi:hypothetical protein
VSTREIRRWDTSGGEVAVVELQEYDGGRRVVAFRRWYRDGDGALRPGRSGVSFPVGDLDELESAVDALRAMVPRPPGPDDAPDDDEQQGLDPAPAPLHVLPFRSQPLPRPFRGLPSPPGPTEAPPAPVARTPAAATPVAPKPVAPAPVAAAPSPRPSIGTSGAASPSLLAEIFASGLVASPLALRLDVRGQAVSGQAFADGSLVFRNRRFATPREAVAELRDQRSVVDAWTAIRYRNPQTNRFARLSRLRAFFQSMTEGGYAAPATDED